MNDLRNLELRALVPACPIKQKDDLFVWTNTHFLRKDGQGLGEGFDDLRRQEKVSGMYALRMHEGIHIHPLIALGHKAFSSFGIPHVEYRFKPNPMLVAAPPLNVRCRIRLMKP